MALVETDRRYLEAWQGKLRQPFSLGYLHNHRPESDLFIGFVEALKEIVPQIAVSREVIPEGELPGLTLGEVWRFHAVPEGKVLEMFGEIGLALGSEAPKLAPGLQSRWEKLPLAPDLTMFIAPQCHFCPQMVRQVVPLTVNPPKAAVTLIDAMLFTELARKNEIKSVPTVIVNGTYRLTGAFQVGELLDLAEKTDPAQLPVSVWERMMQEGQAGVLGEMMLARGLIFPKALPLLLHPEINIRLGAMVALETVGEDKPELIAAILPELWQEYAGSDLAVQGDLVYLIGEWGEGAWIPRLEAAAAATSQPELQEALEEALAKLRDRDGGVQGNEAGYRQNVGE